MHLWHNPHHVDWEVYEAWQKEAGPVKRWIDWFRHLTARIREPPIAQNETSSTTNYDPDKPILPTKKRFVFLRTPKRIGNPLDAKYDGEVDPEGWGMFFEEGFQVHRLLFAFLIFYFFGSVGFMASIMVKFGPITPSTWPALIAFWSWIISFVALTVTVWFKWAEQ